MHREKNTSEDKETRRGEGPNHGMRENMDEMEQETTRGNKKKRIEAKDNKREEIQGRVAIDTIAQVVDCYCCCCCCCCLLLFVVVSDSSRSVCYRSTVNGS